MKKGWLLGLICSLLVLVGCMTNTEANDMKTYTFPGEDTRHEGTCLIWPHQYTYGEEYKEELEPIWTQMAKTLSEGEHVHIIAYNEKEKEHISTLLTDEGVDMSQVDFTIAKK